MPSLVLAPRLHALRQLARALRPAPWVLRPRRCSAAVLCLAGACTPALAADSGAGESRGLHGAAVAALQSDAARSGGEGAGLYELNTMLMPGAGAGAGAGGSAASALALRADAASNATQHVDLTRWLTPGAPRSLGFSMGLAAAAPPTGGLGAAGAPAAPPRLDLGVRWRSRMEGGRHLHLAAWAEAPPDTMGLIWQRQEFAYGTRMEMQWKSSRTRGLVPEFGAIGVQLQGSSRLVLRARKGGPMLYYRAKF